MMLCGRDAMISYLIDQKTIYCQLFHQVMKQWFFKQNLKTTCITIKLLCLDFELM